MHEEAKKKAKSLLERYQNGTASAEEERIIRSWFDQYRQENPAEQLPPNTSAELYRHILRSIRADAIKRRSTRLWRYAVAASILLAVTIGLSIYLDSPSPDDTANALEQVDDVLPGGNEAQLTFGDGNTLLLSEWTAPAQEIPGVEIDNERGVISFVNYQAAKTTEPTMNTIRTENGGQYTVILRDGSTVKLNANSSLRFPSSFGDTRQVYLDGEAYFDVKRVETSPFVVEAGFQKVEVLGTQFNITSYREDNTTTTALVSGSVRVSSTDSDDRNVLILNPGDMASNGQNITLKRRQIAPKKAKAWQDGEFYFDGENLEEIMTIIARWYNVKVIYEHQPSKDTRYGGIISRNRKLSSVLALLEEKENLKFEIKGKQVIVRK